MEYEYTNLSLGAKWTESQTVRAAKAASVANIKNVTNSAAQLQAYGQIGTEYAMLCDSAGIVEIEMFMWYFMINKPLCISFITVFEIKKMIGH